jgi:hypothetical protein
MLRVSPNPRKDLDPAEIALIDCLRVFARRGRELRQEQVQSKAVNVQPLAGETLTAEQKNHALGGVQHGRL